MEKIALFERVFLRVIALGMDVYISAFMISAWTPPMLSLFLHHSHARKGGSFRSITRVRAFARVPLSTFRPLLQCEHFDLLRNQGRIHSDQV